MQKLKAKAFLQAANLIKKELKKPKKEEGYLACCEALSRTLKTLHFSGDPGDLRHTAEYAFFKKLVAPKKGHCRYWFGVPDLFCDESTSWCYYRPNVPNQRKRIKALMKAYKAAVRHNKGLKNES